jgi:hypothetical protein
MTTPVKGIAGEFIDAAESAQSLQAYIQLVYGQTANSVLVTNLNDLQSSLGTTITVVNLLSGLQTLKNYINIKSVAPLPGNIARLDAVVSSQDKHGNNQYLSYSALVLKIYEPAAGAYFSTPTQFSVTLPGNQTQGSVVAQFARLADQLSAEIVSLSAVTPRLSTGTPGVTTEDPNSLLAKARLVLTDIRNSKGTNLSVGASETTGWNALQYWVKDNYTDISPNASDSGAIQQNLTNAITAAQSLNTTQSSSVENYLYLFQEYYQSAASLITAINQIITQIAQNFKQ